jgi:predicted DNA-binding transcriptional regulator AlpA
MTRVTAHEYAAALRPRYRAARRRDKKRILDEFCQTTGWHRKAAIRLLNAGSQPRPVRRGRPRRYGPEVVEPLQMIWEVGDRMCGKLLKAAMPHLLHALERHGELNLRDETRELLLSMSASTIDRMLRRRRRRLSDLLPKHKAPAAASLKSEVPVRTWSEWQGVTVGELQADLVLHCGESTEGFYLSTLCTVDVASGWSQRQVIWGHGKQRVGAGMHYIRRRLPFALRALHTDNGLEFINRGLIDWCKRHEVRFSRGRPYKKNDQAWVEQRNWQSVRRLVGYGRFSSKPAYELLLRLYPLVDLQMNFFRPLRKLVGKQRQGAKVSKRYDEPRTPYQRLVASGALGAADQTKIDKQLEALNPAELQREIERLLRKLWQLADQREGGSFAHVG